MPAPPLTVWIRDDVFHSTDRLDQWALGAGDTMNWSTVVDYVDTKDGKTNYDEAEKNGSQKMEDTVIDKHRSAMLTVTLRLEVINNVTDRLWRAHSLRENHKQLGDAVALSPLQRLCAVMETKALLEATNRPYQKLYPHSFH